MPTITSVTTFSLLVALYGASAAPTAELNTLNVNDQAHLNSEKPEKIYIDEIALGEAISDAMLQEPLFEANGVRYWHSDTTSNESFVHAMGGRKGVTYSKPCSKEIIAGKGDKKGTIKFAVTPTIKAGSYVDAYECDWNKNRIPAPPPSCQCWRKRRGGFSPFCKKYCREKDSQSSGQPIFNTKNVSAQDVASHEFGKIGPGITIEGPTIPECTTANSWNLKMKMKIEITFSLETQGKVEAELGLGPVPIPIPGVPGLNFQILGGIVFSADATAKAIAKTKGTLSYTNNNVGYEDGSTLGSYMSAPTFEWPFVEGTLKVEGYFGFGLSYMDAATAQIQFKIGAKLSCGFNCGCNCKSCIDMMQEMSQAPSSILEYLTVYREVEVIVALTPPAIVSLIWGDDIPPVALCDKNNEDMEDFKKSNWQAEMGFILPDPFTKQIWPDPAATPPCGTTGGALQPGGALPTFAP